MSAEHKKAGRFNIKEYQELIDTLAKVEYKKLSSKHLIDYSELVNIGTQVIHKLCSNSEPDKYNKSYLSTAVKWAIRNEVRRRYKWYTCKNSTLQQSEFQEDLRAAVYKTILSIDEMTDNKENPRQIKDNSQTPDEFAEFKELKTKVEACINKLPPREKLFIEQI